ncbi:MAG: hypothetical protein QM771_02320 [Nitrospira sp.]
MQRRGPAWMVMGLVLFLGACNSDRPEPAETDVPSAGLRLRVTRVATHPFLSRYRLTLRVEGPHGCADTAELFPDTGYAGRRNVYEQASGTITLLGQYDARVIDRTHCTIRLVEFQSLGEPSKFLGAFDVDAEKRWQFIPASVRSERPFEKH